MKILITGANGLLGQKIVALCMRYGYPFLATSKGENRNPDCPAHLYYQLDITNKLELHPVFEAFYPTHVIHTAAITNVDYCEIHPDDCKEVNTNATAYLFDLCQRFHAHFQLLSTDFVFDGLNGPYAETDKVNPLSTYAHSKAEAEKLLIDSPYLNWSVVRTIIVYGQGNNLSRSNMVLWVKDSLEKGQEINVVDDQFRMPTWVFDLAWGCLAILSKDKTGIYHLSGKDFVSMYDFALQIADFFKLDKGLIKRITSASLNQPAKRPPKTGFIIQKAIDDLGYKPKSIDDTLGLIQ